MELQPLYCPLKSMAAPSRKIPAVACSLDKSRQLSQSAHSWQSICSGTAGYAPLHQTYLPTLRRKTAARCSTALRQPPAPLQLRPRDACGFLLHAAKDFRQCRTRPALDCAPSFFPSLRPCARLPPRCVRLFDCQAALRPTMHPHFHTPVRCIPNPASPRSEEHTSELQSLRHLVCRLL